ncbi:MAG: glycosyltransferase, partial [Candidatus Dormiibacterota bacterium]
MAIETQTQRDAQEQARPASGRRVEPPAVQQRVRIDGKHFKAGSERFAFRGVTYGTFAKRRDGALFPESKQLRDDLAAMAKAGFTVVRTYTPPPPDMLEAAAEFGLRILAGLSYQDWRYIVGGGTIDRESVRKDALDSAAAFASSVAGNPTVLGICIGNEVPADVIRWVGIKPVRTLLADISALIHDIDPGQLVTYANYPTAEYLHGEESDFVTFNVFLETRSAFHRYLTKLQHAAGGRPLVMGEVGLDAGTGRAAEKKQAEVLEWQLEVAMDRGVAGCCIFSWTDAWVVGGKPIEDWHFGLTRRDRSPRLSLKVAEKWNRREVRDLRDKWPSISVVICAHNAEATLDECLSHACALDYEPFEVIVVDDGSTDATAEIARKRDVRLLSIAHGGLAAARNEGMRAATGEIVAYLDSDAYPSPEWLLYLALGFDRPDVVGVGGPNTPPPQDGLGSHQVAAAPGGPVHVLLGDDRAEHIPGCNMAFRKTVLEQVGGFDPIFTVAGDDVDMCWRVIDRGWHIGFHPAAQIWHHRRPGLRAYLRQQVGYGRSEALVEARHPYRFTSAGTARWRGRIYQPLGQQVGGQRIYRGIYGTAGYQSVYGGGGRAIDFAHQVGVPIAFLSIALSPVALIAWPVAIVSLSALAFLMALAVIDFGAATPPTAFGDQGFAYRTGVTLMHLLQPLSRSLARTWHRPVARKRVMQVQQLVGPAQALPGGVVMMREDRPRGELVEDILALLRQAGAKVVPPTGWEAYDARLLPSILLAGDLTTSSHPVGWVQVRLSPTLRSGRALLVAISVVALTAVAMPAA